MVKQSNKLLDGNLMLKGMVFDIGLELIQNIPFLKVELLHL
jgi:hypothetical protein